MTADGIEACHQTGKSKENSKLLFALLIGNIANVSLLTGRHWNPLTERL